MPPEIFPKRQCRPPLFREQARLNREHDTNTVTNFHLTLRGAQRLLGSSRSRCCLWTRALSRAFAQRDKGTPIAIEL
jgi:hypothetical protein